MWLVRPPWCVHAGTGLAPLTLAGLWTARRANNRSTPSPGHWYRCIEEDEAGLLDLEQMPNFGKGLDLRKAAEEAFEVKDVFNSTLDSETIKQTLYRQAKNQVGIWQNILSSLPPACPIGLASSWPPLAKVYFLPHPVSRNSDCNKWIVWELCLGATIQKLRRNGVGVRSRSPGQFIIKPVSWEHAYRAR